MSVTIENLVTSGTFSLDGGTWDVDNNVWIVGNEEECVIIDSPHEAEATISERFQHVLVGGQALHDLVDDAQAVGLDPVALSGKRGNRRTADL
jgi:glyoxylase-like metal-dependent hydrolase (beta-lactamase superfamily II)